MARQLGNVKNQTFRLEAPAPKKVLPVGDVTNWLEQAVPMRKGDDGVWTTSTGLPTGTLDDLFIVDCLWCDDTECPLRVPNPYGGQNMVRQVV